MKNKKSRSYNSLIRQKQAEDTKNRIADAADALIKERGYENATINAIAERAGVATQTVYAVFNSKQGILMHLLKRAERAGNKLEMEPGQDAASLAELLHQMVGTSIKRGHEDCATMNALGGFEIIYPELSELIQESSQIQRDNIQQKINNWADAHDVVLDPDKKKPLTDAIIALTNRHLYYELFIESNWPVERYENLFHKIMDLLIAEFAPEQQTPL